MTPLQKTSAGVFAAVALATTLAGCATAADDTTAADTTTESTATGPYTDGTYEASGSYQSPNGTESVDVTITLEGDIITEVEVVGNGESPDSKRYQGEFIDGIAAEVVGKDIDEISVDRVGGSSLTSGGFNAAVEEIKAEAA
jgi:uncharacterized protein with FMN-binding domain